jgi:Lipase (class 3)
MATTLDLALLAGASYFSTRGEINQFPIPATWNELIAFRDKDDSTGFEARTFNKGTEIVISYAGNASAIDWTANVELGSYGGGVTEQLKQALRYYLDVRKANPNATISLTGHSLGGGLAALVGVFFGEQAVTFDQAPFALTAKLGGANVLAYLQLLYTNGQRTYADTLLAPLISFVTQQSAPGAPVGLIPNSSLISNVRVEGEALGAAYLVLNAIGNSTLTMTHGPGLGPVDLHSHALLTAFLQSDKTATVESGTTQSLAEAFKKLTDLLKMIFDSKLFAFSTATLNTTKVNFLEHLVRHVPVPTRAC